MAIQPSTAQLRGGDSQSFTCDVANCTWTELPAELGKITPYGQVCVYTAPPKSKLWFSRQVELTAKTDGESAGVAVITLSSAPVWITAIGFVYMLTFFGLVISVIALWPPAPAVPWMQLTPPSVTVAPGFQQQFQARIWDARDQGVTWSATDGIMSPTGLFTAPKTGGTVVITATSAADHNLTQSALVVLNAKGMAVRPDSVTLSTSQSAKLEVVENGAPPAAGSFAPAPTQTDWSVSDPAAKLSSTTGTNVIVQAPPRIPLLTRVIVTAVDHDDHTRQASTVLNLTPSPMPLGGELAAYELSRDKRLILLVMLMGALGALLGASRSFANFVGNASFFPRWSLFYVFRPTFGAGLALLVFFGYRIGAVVGVRGAAPADPFAATFVAGMVGLFADTVLQKLKDLITALFPSQDDRKDKIATSASMASAATAPPPAIESAQGNKQNNLFTVKGQNFASGASVVMNGKARTTVFVSATELHVTLDASDAAGDVKVAVMNLDKQASAEFKGTITA